MWLEDKLSIVEVLGNITSKENKTVAYYCLWSRELHVREASKTTKSIITDLDYLPYLDGKSVAADTIYLPRRRELSWH